MTNPPPKFIMLNPSIITSLKNRAALYQKIRAFFAEKNVLEVETPILCQHTVTDPYIESFKVPVSHNQTYFLQTSPEYAMKRLLAAGSGSIYQITKSFRVEESGRHHNPEFTMLEWYRVGFNHHDLMREIDALLQFAINTKPAEKITYQQLFLKHLQVDPLNASLADLKKIILQYEIAVDTVDFDHDTAMQILLSHLIEPKLGFDQPLFIYDFPASQAALSQIKNGVAERFELYINGMEIANGFHELTDAKEQLARFEKNQKQREKQGKIVPAIDHYFIDALKSGLPDCSGVALGLDRLLMCVQALSSIDEVLAFPFRVA